MVGFLLGCMFGGAVGVGMMALIIGGRYDD